MKRFALSVLLSLVAVASLSAQDKPNPVPPAKGALPAARRAAAPGPREIVRDWFRRWNALDGTKATADRFIDLYVPTAIHQTEPSEKQIGPVYYEGHAAIRKFVDDFTNAAMQPAYTIDKVMQNGKGTELFFMSAGPWGGPAVGVQFTGSYVEHRSKERHVFPGFALFHIERDKIRYARFYTTRDENRGE